MRALRAALLVASLAVAFCSIDISTSPPGGLSPDQVPQFILFSHDDAVNSESYDAVRSIAEGRVINGCPVTATMFVKVDGTDCDDLVDLYNSGYEIADHSISHESFPDLSQGDMEWQILGAREELAKCGIPEGAIVGMRTPYLRSFPDVRQVLYENGFLYDSTQRIESDDPSERLWPWDMANGLPDCESGGSQPCDSDESWPGLFQVPVWFLDAQGQPYHMNYGDDGAVDVYSFLKEAFDASYHGNRAPMPLFVHTPWIEEFDNGLRQFVDYASTLPDVYFVTMRQLIAWMKNPIPKDRLTPQALGCGNAGGAEGAVPMDSRLSDPNAGSPPPEAGWGAPLPGPAPAPIPAPAPGPAEEEDWSGLKDGEGSVEPEQMWAPSTSTRT